MDDVRSLAIALAIGLLLGFERERRASPGAEVTAGSRTFAIVALLGGLAALVSTPVVVVSAVIVGALIVASYLRSAADGHGLTTEVALLLVFVLGVVSREKPEIAVSSAIVVAVLLASRDRLHQFARSVVTETELEDALKFLVAAFVVLPLLPSGARGPYGVLDAHRIWTLVVIISGIGWVGYVATRLLGATRGLLVAGFAGGFVSASATTAAMGRRAKAGDATRNEALVGALAASITTLVYLGFVIGYADVDLLRRLLPSIGVSLGVGVVELVVLVRRTHRQSAEADRLQGSNASAPPSLASTATVEGDETVNSRGGASGARAFQLLPAVLIAGVLTSVLLAVRWASDHLGSSAAVATAGIAGLADTHGAAAAVATLTGNGKLGLGVGAAAVAAALAANTGTKCVLAFVAGGRSFGTRFLAILGLMVIAFAAPALIQAFR